LSGSERRDRGADRVDTVDRIGPSGRRCGFAVTDHPFGSRDGLIDTARAVEFTRRASEDVAALDLTKGIDRDTLLAQLDRINRVLSAADRWVDRRQRIAIFGRAASHVQPPHDAGRTRSSSDRPLTALRRWWICRHLLYTVDVCRRREPRSI